MCAKYNDNHVWKCHRGGHYFVYHLRYLTETSEFLTAVVHRPVTPVLGKLRQGRGFKIRISYIARQSYPSPPIYIF